jgi:holin-like protein
VIGALTALLGCQLAGEVLVRLAGVPVPGPVLGMLLLFVALLFRQQVPKALRAASQGLLDHLSLLFVPAGTGIMLHFARIEAEWLPVIAALIVSTILTIVVTAAVFRSLSPPEPDGDRHEAEGL